jgi:cytoskeletal protein RodZ
MSSSDQEKQQRNREIAQNEAVRQNTSALRVSGWAIAFVVVVGVVAVWLWLNR